MRKHATTIHGDGGKPELHQARCTCGWETGYVSEYTANRKAREHRAKEGYE